MRDATEEDGAMQAIIVDTPGTPEVLALRDVSEPALGEDQVLIEIAYCGCNWADTMIRSGTYPHPMTYPLVPGFELSGRIIGVGARASRWKIGQRVCAISGRGGGYAEKVAVDQAEVMPVPDDVPLQVAAAFPIQALTSYHILHTIYGLRAGDVVLCHAIGGGLGLYVTQLAVKAGARVIGTVGTKGKEALPLSYGAERVINQREEEFAAAVMAATDGRGVDLAIDSLGATTLDRTYGVMRDLGHIVSIGEAEGAPFSNIWERLIPRSLTFTRFHLQHVGPGTDLWEQGRRAVVEGLSLGWLQPNIVQTFPMSEAAEMHRQIEGRQVSGKLLLAINPGL
jgi:NADPH2:quinone reductase